MLMNGVLRILFALCLTLNISWSGDSIIIERLLKADYSSVIIDEVRNQLRKQLDSGTLSPEKIRQLVHDPELEQRRQKLCGVDLNIALGACLISDVFTIEECIARYEFYHDSHHHGRCYPQADGLEPWEWAVVLRGKESLEDLA